MKIKELRSKKREELEEQLAQANKELIKLNTQVATGTTLKSPGLVKKTKKTIARILTLLNQKEGSKKDE
ncbi:50S ribosomal protein L29 [archaeon]|jgi:ribosomal protein L29|nr:50S ribosomal protein L29 [archaeon]MBT4272475.1 50S ribosomal protein L29 [archaeon]MBT4460573.1 50S ribosomal protein L29 [archaeon]MBT4857837.1 50S ribosomal protein L29 [archaeon]MBT5423148.1 50S ribosomal protein L29 [archaeon]